MELELIIAAVFSFMAGLSSGYYVWGSRATEIELVEWPATPPAVLTVYETSPVLQVSPGRKAVTFRFVDGSVERKILFDHSAKPVVLWRDREFAMQPNTSSPIIYNEVTY